MNQSTTNLIPHFTGSASLAALGLTIRKLDLLEPIRKLVSIPQKTVKDSPLEKLSDAFISILAGVSGLVEVNTRAARVIAHCSWHSGGAAVPNNR
jgi:hypothetical protein